MRASRAFIALAAVCVSSAAWSATPSATTEGRLVTRHGKEVVDVPLEHTRVHIRVDGDLADATVTQRYRNPFDRKIEAVYLFPLPTGAAVTDMTITTGTRTIRGTIQERAKAKQIYVAAKQRGLVAALLTQERANLFTQAVANLEPAATVEITLRYVQRLDYDAGRYSLVFPMVAGPRYIPPASAAKAQAAAVQPVTLPPGLRSAHDIDLDVELDAGVAIENVGSSSHQIAIERPAPARATVRIRPGDTIPNKDFILTYQVAGDAPKLGLLAHRDGGTGSFVLIAQPPTAAEPARVAPREIIFLLDTSSSMRGAPIAKAKELIKRVLWTLRPDDTYQIVRFADRASALGPGPIANKPRNVELTLDWLAKLDTGGGTDVIDGVAAALALPHDPLRVRLIVFISDGYVGNEDEILAAVGAHVGSARLFSFGVGSAVNRYLLEEMAAFGRGAVQVVRPDEDTARAVALFERRIDAPILTDITIDWGGLPVSDVVPAAVPDLFVGQPLAITGHYTRGASGTVTVRARQAGRAVELAIPVALPDVERGRPAIAALWARQRIGELSRSLVRKANPAAEREIIALSLEHRVLSQHTAFVAVDESRVTAGGEAKRIVVPVEVPDAVRAIPISGSGSGGYASYGSLGGTGYGSGYGALGSSLGSQPRVASKTAAPIVHIGAAASVGDLDNALIRRYVKRQHANIRYCYEKALLRAPKLEGTVTSTFAIDNTSGKVLSATATGLGDKEVEACIAAVIKSIEFPHTTNGGVVRVNYPFKLQVAP